MFRSRHHRSRFARRATAAVELALLLPFLMFLFVVAVDFARIFYTSLTLTNCARNGALYAADPMTDHESPYANYQAAALADATSLSPAPTVTSTTGVDAGGNDYVEVTVACSFRTITSYPGVPSPLNLTRTVRMRILPDAAE